MPPNVHGVRRDETPLRILWTGEFSTSHGLTHGATLRLAHLARSLVRYGHSIHVLTDAEELNRPNLTRMLDQLVKEGFFTDYVVIPPPIPSPWQWRFTLPALHPLWRRRLLAGSIKPATNATLHHIERIAPDVCIVGSWRHWNLLPLLADRLPVVIDWCDSYTLYHLRQVQHAMRTHHFRRIARSAWELAVLAVHEWSLRNVAAGNLFASPADRRCFDRLSNHPERSYVLPNGVETPLQTPAHQDKIAGRLIFSGNLDFPPNVEAAIWFIDYVLPLVLIRHPHVRFVVAGQNPAPAILARVSDRVIVAGFVTDMRQEIAKSELYVAPMVTGSGFKNKVMEALAAGTCVAATSLAVEFMEEDLQQQLIVASTAEQLARAIGDHLNDPRQAQRGLSNAQSIVTDRYGWDKVALALESIIRTIR